MRLDRERAGQRDPLALPARQLRGPAPGEHVELHQLEQAHHGVADLVLGGTHGTGPHPESEGDVLEDVHVTKQSVVLEDEPDLALADRLGGRVLAVEVDRAPIGRLQPGDDAEQRGLARSRGTEQGHQLAARHVEAHVVEGDEVAERLAQMTDLDAHAAILSGGGTTSVCSAAARCCRHSTRLLRARVTKASRVSTEATAKLAAKAYSL